MTVITISKKPNLINYNNAPWTKTQLFKKKKKNKTKNNIKFKHNIEKKITSEKKLNTGGREKRPEASTFKEYMEFPWSITLFFIYIYKIWIDLFPHHSGVQM